jgi:hypothetical protein
MDRGDVIAEAVKHFMDIHGEYLEAGYRPKGQEMTFMSNARMMTGPLSLHYGVFMSTLRSQGSEVQMWWCLQ